MKKLISLLLAVMFAFSLMTVSTAEGQAFTGVVVSNSGSTFTVSNAYGTSLTFTKSSGILAVPAIGSTVTVDYSGDVTTELIAEDVIVETAAVVKTANGVIRAISGQNFVLETPNSVVLNIYVTSETSISGLAKELAVGQSVSVIYSESVQYVSVVDIATSIEVTALPVEVIEETVEIDVPSTKSTTNKHLTGVVTKLSGSKVTIKTSKGRTWSFRLTGSTTYSGKYDFEVGCTVRVTYDGYASKVPAAKKIKVTKAKSSVTTHTKRGTCSFFGGMMIGLTNGFEADVAYAKHSGSGAREPGTQVKITYYTENGCNYATRIKWYA